MAFRLNLLGMHQYVMKIRFREIQDYAEALETMLGEESQRLKAHFEKRAALMGEEARQEYLEVCSEDVAVYEDAFPRILRYSLFVHAYSVLEHELAVLARYYKKALALRLSPADLKHSGITQSRIYLKKVAGKPFPDRTANWQDISALGEVRNLIVHRAGVYPQNHERGEKIDALVMRWGGAISVDQGRRFQLSDEFMKKLLGTVAGFIEELFAALAGV
jgi:hypothetical protein